jgi:protein-L-isoaspartate O-methyltransferase
MASQILGPHGHIVAVELQHDVVEHAAASRRAWLESRGGDHDVAPLTAIQGNALNINVNEGEARLGFDRIYIGAAVDTPSLVYLCEMLRPGGILVGPGESLQIVSENMPMLCLSSHSHCFRFDYSR